MTVGKPSGDPAGHVGGGCTPVHPEKELMKDDRPSQGDHRLTWSSRSRGAKAESVHQVCCFGKGWAEKTEKGRDASNSCRSIV